jgi:ADP-heptose:LPS heptosyltransferase
MAVTGNVLVLRALGLGDLLVVVPALRALRAECPEARITLAAPAVLGGLVELTGAVDAVLDTPRLDLLRWRGEPPALAVNLHGRGPASTRQLLRTRPAKVLAHADRIFPKLTGPPWRPEMSQVDRWCDLLRWYGIPADADDLLLARPPVSSPAPGAVVLHPGAAYAARRWPADRFGSVARALADEGHHVVVTGSRDERPLADAVVAAANRPDAVRVAGPTSLTELAALVAEAALVVCGDTGVGHLATAYRVPSVLLFGPTPPASWGPTVDADRHVVLWKGETDDPFASAPTPGLLRVGVPEVIECARALLASTTVASGVPEGVGHG